MLEWHRLVAERNVWIAHNFPDDAKGPQQSTIGCIEEVGELAHAHLKEDQAIRGDSAQHQADAKDAIADLAIYLLGIMNLSRPPREFFSLARVEHAQASLCELAAAVGRLAQHVSRDSTGLFIELERGVDAITHYSRNYCEFRGWDYDSIVTKTWAKVKQRDWIAYPDTGLPPEEKPKGLNSFLVQAQNVPPFPDYHKGDRITFSEVNPFPTGDYEVLEEPVDGSIVVIRVID